MSSKSHERLSRHEGGDGGEEKRVIFALAITSGFIYLKIHFCDYYNLFSNLKVEARVYRDSLNL